MAPHKPKELYWFRYEPKRYLIGKIQYCSLETQGLFANIQCFYWQRDCKMSEADLKKKFGTHDNLLQELITEEIIKIEDGNVFIDFLDEQYEPQRIIKEKLSLGGSNGANKAHENRRKNKAIAEGKSEILLPTAKEFENEYLNKPKVEEQKKADGNFFYIGTKMHDKLVSEYCKEELDIHMANFLMKNKPITRGQALMQMDLLYSSGYAFANHNHIMMAFNKVVRELKTGTGNKFEIKTDAVSTISSKPNIDA